MQNPQNKKELQTFLGMANYLSKFVPNLSTLTEPLRELDRKDFEWLWLQRQEDAM